MRTALDILDEFPPDDIFVIPVRIDDCEPVEEKIRNLHRVDLFPSYENGFEKILKSIFACNLPSDVKFEET